MPQHSARGSANRTGDRVTRSARPSLTTGVAEVRPAESETEHREQLRRSRVGALIARGRYEDAAAALGVCWPEEHLPRQVRAALARGRPERIDAFLTAFRASAPQHFVIRATELDIPYRQGFAELVLVLRVDDDTRFDVGVDADADTAGATDAAVDADAGPAARLAPIIELCRAHLLDLAIGRAVAVEQAPNSLASARARAV
ncbi:hypothetical protein ACFPZL_08620, partial [Leucobacter soli]